MTKTAAYLLPVLMLAGCGSGDGKTESPNGRSVIMASTGYTGPIRAGQWQVVSTGDVAGSDSMCITPEQIAADSFAGRSLDGRDCTVSRDRMSAGVIEVAAQCGSGRHPMTIRGTYTETGFNLATTLEIPVQGKIETLRSNRSGRWVAGDCSDEVDEDDG